MGKGRQKSGKKGTASKKNEFEGDNGTADSIETPHFDAHQVLDVMPQRESQHMKADNSGTIVVKDFGDKAAHHMLDDLPQRKTSDIPSGSASISQSLGSHDTFLEPASDNESAPVGDKEQLVTSNKDEHRATPWVNLFKENRTPNKGLNLETHKLVDDDFVLLEDYDIPSLHKEWGYGLIGYVAGRFPGKKALLQCCDKWGVSYTFSSHDSGWLIFKFNSEEDRNQVLANGPYFIFQRPLLLKIMPELFDFGDEELSKFPVWVKLRNLPLELWNATALGKILSRVGNPIRTDYLTATKGSLSFARALVEVDASMDLVHEVKIKTPKGVSFVQHVEFENIPTFCKQCKVIGHNLKNCKALNGSKLIDSNSKCKEIVDAEERKKADRKNKLTTQNKVQTAQANLPDNLVDVAANKETMQIVGEENGDKALAQPDHVSKAGKDGNLLIPTVEEWMEEDDEEEFIEPKSRHRAKGKGKLVTNVGTDKYEKNRTEGNKEGNINLNGDCVAHKTSHKERRKQNNEAAGEVTSRHNP